MDIKKVIVKDHDGNDVSETDKVSVTLNFPMWFGDELIKEINDKDITVIVMKNFNGQVFIHLATTDKDLIIRAQKEFWKYRL